MRIAQIVSCLLALLLSIIKSAAYTRQDTLHATNGAGRSWWNVLHYDLNIDVDSSASTISGTNTITFKITGEPGPMQIDLQTGMQLDTLTYAANHIACIREGNVYWISDPGWGTRKGQIAQLMLRFSGRPHQTNNPPWESGLVSTRDSQSNRWIAVASKTYGGSIWWPCKDYPGDKPDSGMSISVQYLNGNGVSRAATPSVLSNGRSETAQASPASVHPDATTRCIVRNPIAPSNVTLYIGAYTNWRDTLHGAAGVLDLEFYPLYYHKVRALQQWKTTSDILHCYEYWFGPYPFYKDGFKLVEAPYVGQANQGAIAYGNGFKNGYRGKSIVNSPIGLSYDWVLAHSIAQEWFGNSITAADNADNWVSEGFATYAEVLLVEHLMGRDSAFEFVQKLQDRTDNRTPVIGPYAVNYRGNSDMSFKGACVIHTIRTMMHDDTRFRLLLHNLVKEFGYKSVSSAQIEAYIGSFVGKDLRPFFNQYLREKDLPFIIGTERGSQISLVVEAASKYFKLPVYDKNGRFICELSATPVSIAITDLSKVLEYLIAYAPHRK